MGKLNGGVFLLDLSHISLEESDDSQDWTIISDGYTLEQLDKLRQYLVNPSAKKTIWCKLVDDNADVVCQGALLQTSPSFLIDIHYYNYHLQIVVTFDFDVETGEPFIDTATWNMLSNVSLLKEVDLEVKSLKVDGNAEIGGVLKVNEYELDEDITISDLPTNLNCNYAHARISNGKLNIVIALYLEQNKSLEQTDNVLIGSIALSNDILSKLYPYLGVNLATKCDFLASQITSAISSGKIAIRISKDTTGITFRLGCDAISLNAQVNRDCRFEFNFIL